MRKPMITRTLVTTIATLLVADTVGGELINTKVNIARKQEDDKKIIKAFNADNAENNLVAVQVVNKEFVEELRGMTEEDFYNHSVPVERNSNKEIEKE